MVGANLMTSIIPSVVAVAGTVAIVKHVFPLGGKGKGKSISHYHYKGRGGPAVSHSHAGGHLSHKHRGLPGYGRKKSTLRR